ncbi:hypothetical protein CK556_00240 [Mesoplasma chauliocola]|uniref:HTH rpiR-type domain-containing protein n=1 Tax=Mesoplasma chauliocola TaxID=216427 RepID=A0A249SMC1_9MOLU|nr:hypothetical protein [Mesoplasma chauliocola]ASZ08796.1 hypothetical protein CK556_00240 [Mesoplasma chauliocola]
MENFYEKLEYLSKGYVDSAYRNLSSSLLNSIGSGKFLKSKELAEECFVSESTITKFSKFLGFSGYRELLFHLKNDHDAFFALKKNAKNKSFQDLERWVETKENFIEKLSKELVKKEIVVNIFRSYQLTEVAELINMALLNLKIESRVLNHNNLFNGSKKNYNKRNINLIFFSGRDNDTLEMFVKKYEISLNKEDLKHNNFLIISERQKNKIDIKSNTITFTNDHSQFDRSMQIMMLFYNIRNKIQDK